MMTNDGFHYLLVLHIMFFNFNTILNSSFYDLEFLPFVILLGEFGIDITWTTYV